MKFNSTILSLTLILAAFTSGAHAALPPQSKQVQVLAKSKDIRFGAYQGRGFAVVCDSGFWGGWTADLIFASKADGELPLEDYQSDRYSVSLLPAERPEYYSLTPESAKTFCEANIGRFDLSFQNGLAVLTQLN